MVVVANWLIALGCDMFVCLADHNEESAMKLTWILESIWSVAKLIRFGFSKVQRVQCEDFPHGERRGVTWGVHISAGRAVPGLFKDGSTNIQPQRQSLYRF